MSRIRKFILNIVLISIVAFGAIVILGLLLGLRSISESGGLLIGGGLLLVLLGAGGAVTGGRIVGGVFGGDTATLSAYAHNKTEYDKAVQSSRSRLDRLLDFAETLQFALAGVIIFVVGLVISS